MIKILALVLLATLGASQFYVPNPAFLLEKKNMFLQSSSYHLNKMPDSFKVNFVVYEWQPSEGDLHVLNITGQEFVDANANQERFDIWMNIPNVGYGEL